MIVNPTIVKNKAAKIIPVTITTDPTSSIYSVICQWVDEKGAFQSEEMYGGGTVQMVENTLFGLIGDFSTGEYPSLQNAQQTYPGRIVILCLAKDGATN